MNNTVQQPDVRALLKALSSQDFARIGMNEIAYIRPLSLSPDEQHVYGVYAADGTQMSVLASMDMAIATLRHNDLVPVTLH